jgi:type VI secretion system protein ImpA
MIEPAELESLTRPITAELPCGASLEDSRELASFTAYRIFGQGNPWDPAQTPDWPTIRARALETLGRTKDLRLLAHFGAAVLRIDGLGGFCQVLQVAPQWLEGFWEQVYPGPDEDGIFRRNALSCLADRIAIVDALRRAALVSNRQLGTYSLRDIELSSGALQPAEADIAIAQPAQIAAAFAATPPAALADLVAVVSAALQAVKRIDLKMREAAGTEAVPELQPLTMQLQRVDKVLREHLASHPDAASAEVVAEPGAPTAAPATLATGPIRSRQDAIRALDAVALFFSQTEPSSPVPMFVDRAKRLIAKNFFEVLEDIVPDAVDPARKAGGVRDSG